jgi:DNA-binding IclR family transcriptional regulator
MLGTVLNAGRVLDLFTSETPERGVTEVADALGIPKSRAHALMSSLAHVGLLRRTAEGRYRLGWRVLALGRILTETTEFRAEARRAMEELSGRFGETVHLATLDDGVVVYVDKIEGTRAVRIAVSAVGSMLPAHCSGVGKALLAHRPWEEVAETAERRGLERFTARTITSKEGLARELAAIRRRGYSLDLEEVLPEVCCVAAPIFDHRSRAVAAISVTAPAYRFAEHAKAYQAAVVDLARRVSTRLDYPGA